MNVRCLCLCWLLTVGSVSAATLEVGPGRRFARIEEANAQAAPGDLILVYPQPDNRPYTPTAVLVRKRQLTFRGAPGPDAPRVKLSGQGFSYSGVGSVPRAIFQFQPDADDCLLEGFDLSGAHNDSHNGAGVRINQANQVTVRNCTIHHNDMGLMSGGDGTLARGRDQRIEGCTLAHNGDAADPGYNHNLYLGGASATLSACEIYSSLTGHNVKSRAHYTQVEYCYVHDSANREFDLVDAAETALPDSHAVLLGNIIVKDPHCRGNRGVIHFGQDGKKPHNGALHLVGNTIVTPFASAVVDLSSPGSAAHFGGNLITDNGANQRNQQVAAVRNGAQLSAVTGRFNWFSGGFAPGNGLVHKTNRFERMAGKLFVDPAAHNYHLTPATAAAARASLGEDWLQTPPPGSSAATPERPLAWQYRHPAGREKRPGAGAFTPGALAP